MAPLYTFLALIAFQCFALTVFGASIRNETSWTIEKANEYIAQNKHTVNQTYRYKYHLMAPVGWINDPNGLIYFRGEYHVFYQYNPYNSRWGNIHWGHSKSKDLIHWEDLPVALAPDQDYDQLGIFSGSAIEKDGKLYLIYTGAYADRQVQCVAISEDGINFEKISQNPVLDENDLPSNAIPEHFRDPKVFKRGDIYYALIVSKTTDSTGQVLLYESKDLIDWNFKSILLQGTNGQGVMWECPDLFEMGGKDVMILSPEQLPRSGNNYHNFDSVLGLIGQVDWEQGKLNVERVKELDHGMDYYATQTLTDDKGRRITITWMNMWGRTWVTDALGHGWTGAMALPRELQLKDGHIVQLPIDEMRDVSQVVVDLQNVTIIDETREVDNAVGDVAVLELVVDLQEAWLFNLEVRAGESEKTIVSYNTSSQEVSLDRSQSGIPISGSENPPVLSRKVEAPLIENKLKLQVFLDKASVEVFVNDGVETLTATIYPTDENANKIRIGVGGKAVVENLRFSLIEMEDK